MTSFFGSDATLELTWEAKAYPDPGSERYRAGIESGTLSPTRPFLQLGKRAGELVQKASTSNLWLENEGLHLTHREGEARSTTRLHLEDFREAVVSRTAACAGTTPSVAE